MHLKWIFSAVLIFILAGCATEDAAERTMSFERVATIGLDNPSDADGEPLFGAILDVDVDMDGQVYVLDAQYHRIRVFSSTGALSRTIQFQQGTGPGEVQRPVRLSVAPDGTLYMVDMMARKVMKYDRDGEFLLDIPAQGITTQVLATGDRVYLTRLWLTSGDDILFVHDTDGTPLTRFLQKPPEADLVARSGNFGRMVSSATNTLLYSFPYPYRIVELDLEGTVVNESSGHAPFEEGPAPIDNGMVRMPYRTMGLARVSNELTVNVVMEHDDLYFDLFDESLTFVERLDSTRTGLSSARNMKSDGNGHLYFSADAPVPHIIKVRVNN